MVCDTCHGKCCKRFVVFITAHDATRIAKNLNIDPLYFLNYYPEEFTSKYPCFTIKGKSYVLGIDSKDGSMKDCKFLLNIGGYNRCGIHCFRPMSCRTYPFTLEDGKLGSVEEFLCPKQWWPKAEKREEYINNIKQFKKELEEYRSMVETWNSSFNGKGSFMEFLDFTLNRAEEQC